MRRRVITLVAITALGLAAIGFGLLQLSNARNFQLFGEITSRIETSQPAVALTFDDGPTRAFTKEILEILAANDVKATFFLTGNEASENPDEVKAIAAAGHEIGNHSWSHKRMILVGPQFVSEEIENTDNAIRAAGYSGALHFRPPYGKKLVTLPWYLGQTGRRTIMWDVEPETDAASNTAEAIAQHTIDTARPGSIIILHAMYASRETTRAALPTLIAGLKAKGLEFVTVSELLSMR